MTASNVIRGIGGLITLVPSAIILLGIVPVPTAIRVLINYITSGVTVVLLLAIILLGDAIGRIPKAVTAVVILVFVVAGAIAADEYYNFAREQVVAEPTGETLVLPLHRSQELQTLLRPYGEDYTEALATSVQSERISELINVENSSAIAIMISLIVATQVLFIAAIGIGAWRIAHAEEIFGTGV